MHHVSKRKKRSSIKATGAKKDILAGLLAKTPISDSDIQGFSAWNLGEKLNRTKFLSTHPHRQGQHRRRRLRFARLECQECR